MRRLRTPEHLVWIVPAAALLGAVVVWRADGGPDFGRLFAVGRTRSVTLALDDGRGHVAFAFDLDPARAERLRVPLDALFTAYADLAAARAEEGAVEDGAVEGEAEPAPGESEGGPGDGGALPPDAEDRGAPGTLDDVLEPHSEPDVGAGPGTGPGDLPGAEPDEAEPVAPGAFDAALRGLVEAAWNDGVLRWELAAELPVRFWERPLLRGRLAAMSQGDADASDTLRSLFLRHAQGGEERFLLEELLGNTVFDVEPATEGDVHHGFVQLDVEALDTLADALCPVDPARFDACRLFRAPREDTRTAVADLLDQLGETFRVQLHFRWTRRGNVVLVSNTLEGLARMTEEGTSAPVQPPKESGAAAALLPLRPPLGLAGRGGFVALVRQAHLQNNLLALLAQIASPASGTLAEDDLAGEEPGRFAAWLATPEGDDFRGRLEDAVSLLTRWSSELLVEGQRRRGGVVARLWYREPDVSKEAPDAAERLERTASAQAATWLTPWVGARESSTVSWPEPSVALVESSFDGVPPPTPTPSSEPPGPLSQGGRDGPL